MIDQRFYTQLSPIALVDLAKQSGAQIVRGDPQILVHFVSSLRDLTAGNIAFARNKKHLTDHIPTGGVIIADRATLDVISQWPVAALQAQSSQSVFAGIANSLISSRKSKSRSDLVSKSAVLDSGVEINPGAVIGDDVHIGSGSRIGANAVIECGVEIGRNCDIGSGAHIAFTQIGNDVRLMPGVVIGGQGLGVAKGQEGLIDMPHFGVVQIADGVTIGANTTIDRGVFDTTSIGARSKIDNLVQIAHNVEIGEDCIFAAHVGISGSVRIANRVLMGGRVGVTDHRTIGNDVVITAGSAVLHDIPDGQTWSGYPAKPNRRYLREVATLSKLSQQTKKKPGN
ncbi:MAG: UDP-3-O-(3-hydroxymyristoyl)glucosamine N-acyltransferase [Robiginitomaculum sp.]|nr:MAG: UDP-3-O-(3-hydroxymyristoyl)glucosamine N-acyltransferase [Robiginitomaculum sp.]